MNLRSYLFLTRKAKDPQEDIVKRLMLILPLVVLAAAMPALAAGDQYTERAEQALERHTGISGQVTDASNGHLILNAAVFASNSEGVRHVTQGCHGYMLCNLPPGKYFVGAVAPGFEPGAYPESVVVVENEITENIDFSLEPAGGECGAISGTVTDANTTDPIPFAQVATFGGMARTDSAGYYIVRGLRPGRYLVIAGSMGYEKQIYPDTVVVEPGLTTENIDFALEPCGEPRMGRIAGKVTDARNGEVIRGALVLASADGITKVVAQCCHGYRIGGLPPGKYFVGARALGFEPGAYPESVEVRAGQVTEHIDIVLRPCGGERPGGISGTVTNEGTGEPLFGALVFAMGPTPGRLNTNPDGMYLIRHLAPGTYTVVAKARGFESSGPREVEVVAGELTEDIDFQLKPCSPAKPGAISGMVTDSATGLPLLGARVFAWGPAGQGHTRTDSSGNYKMRLKPGRYIVRANARGYYPALYPEIVVVVEEEVVPDINFALKPGRRQSGGIAGFVYDGQEQTELQGAVVTAVGPNGSFEVQAGANGEYLFDDLEPGEYQLEVTVSGYTVELYPEPVVVGPADIAAFTNPAIYPLTGVEESPAAEPAAEARLIAEPSLVMDVARIHWQVPVAGRVTVQVLDNVGRVVRNIQNGYQEAGQYTATWNGTRDNGQRVASGVYFYRLDAPSCRELHKTVLLGR